MKPKRFEPAGRDEHGSTVVYALVLLASLLALAIAGLTGASADLKVSRNYNTGVQALLAGEEGILHAQAVINATGVVTFNGDIVPAWSTLFGSSPVTVPGHSTITYSVTATNDATDPTGFMLLTSVGQAPDESERSIRVRLTRAGVFSPGAIYLPNPSVSTTFNGNNFLIDGDDTNFDGTLHPAGDVPGIGTATSTAADGVTTSLNGGQSARVLGTGGTPSVEYSAGPTTDRITDTIVPHILTSPGVITNPLLTGADTFGTRLLPQITHFTGNVTINGNLGGAGILIVDQGLTVNGSVTFTGLIIVRGTTEITSVSGNATLLGALWTTDLNLTVSGSASITYSSQALALANGLALGDLLPQHVKAISWTEL